MSGAKSLRLMAVALAVAAWAVQCQPLPTAEQFARVDAGDSADSAADSGPAKAFCGNGLCDGEETVNGCPLDCAEANRHLANACTSPGSINGCPTGYICVARSVLGGGAVCVADFATWPQLPTGHPEGSYVSGSQTATDLLTGLTWSTHTSDAVRDFDATLFCAQVKDDGFRDWRLPTRAELHSLVDFNHRGLMVSAPGFDDGAATCHWSASKAAAGWGSWVVNLSGGNAMTYADLYTCVVRCVRGQPSDLQLRGDVPRYTQLPGGQAVLDRQTGLRWRTKPAEGERNQLEARSYCQSLRLLEAGSGWRLPSVRESLELLDLRRHDPSLSPVLQMPTQGSAVFHTATPVVPHVAMWEIDFANGHLNGSNLPADGPRQTRCVQ
jgi:hypothetical protein